MALKVFITKLNPQVSAPAKAAAPLRAANGRFIPAKARPSTKGTVRTKAPYRINAAGSVVPFNGGTILGVILKPSLRDAMVKAGLAA